MTAKPQHDVDAFDGVPLGDLIRRRTGRLLAALSRGPVEGLHPVMMREVERALVGTVLEHTTGKREEAARILGLHRNTLRLRLTALGIDAPAVRKRSRKRKAKRA